MVNNSISDSKITVQLEVFCCLNKVDTIISRALNHSSIQHIVLKHFWLVACCQILHNAFQLNYIYRIFKVVGSCQGQIDSIVNFKILLPMQLQYVDGQDTFGAMPVAMQFMQYRQDYYDFASVIMKLFTRGGKYCSTSAKPSEACILHVQSFPPTSE